MQYINSTQGQWLGDVVIKHTGVLEALFELAELNDLSITDRLTAGSPLEPVQPVDKRVVNYYTRNGIHPATEMDADLMQGIGYWYIGLDFVVS